MQTSSFVNSQLLMSQKFTDFEKEALGEMVLKEIQSDLQRYLDKFHLQQVKNIEKKMAGFEQKCTRQIQESIEENVKLQLKSHFQKVIESCQKDITDMTSPLFKRAEKDVQSLTNTVTKANAFCKNIKMQYALRWSTPFFTLVGTASLTGALIGLFLLFSQVPFISAFFMNAHMREAYITGLRVIDTRKELEAQATQISASQAISQEQTVQKAPEALKLNTSQKQKKKKKSK